MLIALRKIIEELGCDVTPVSDGKQALDALQRCTYNLVVTDLRMPLVDGMQVVRASVSRTIPVIVLTGHGTVESAVEAMRLGATDFLSKPFEVPQVERVVRAALSGGQPERPRSGRPISGRPERPPEQPLIGSSTAMESVRRQIDRIADADGTVLITGESGVGKEVVAHLIHSRSRRRDRPFIPVNCAAIPEQLLESELFGHTRGAFTGATQHRTGRFELADGGTLFLDEIGEMPPAMQAKVLRVLQDKEVMPVGASRSVRVNVRIVAATNKDLREMAERGAFRDDLYYRLNVFRIHLPPLRDRPEDIKDLLVHFLTRSYAKRGEAAPPLSEVMTEEALERVMAHPFPGNVRELESLVERIVHLRSEGQVLGPADLPLEPPRRTQRSGRTEGSDVPWARAPLVPQLPEEGIDLRNQMESFQRSLISQALQRADGNRTVAAEYLRIKRTTLVMMIRRHGLDQERRRH